jgi:RNA 2',3'-cyclic 3'-phosphodiesterase
MRLFAAIDIDAAVRAKIAATQRRIADVAGEAAHDLRFLEPGQLHLTLVFIGEADADRARVVVDAMSADLPLPSFQMHLGEVGVLPPHGAPRVLYVAIGEGRSSVAELQRLVAARLEACGVARERRPFLPHLTIARWRKERSRTQRWMVDRRLAVSAASAVEAVTLFRSELSRDGSAYTRLARAQLRGAPAVGHTDRQGGGRCLEKATTKPGNHEEV